MKKMCSTVQGCDGGNEQLQSYNFTMTDNMSGGNPTSKIKTTKNHIYFYDDITRQSIMQLRITIQGLIDQLFAIQNDLRGEVSVSNMSINLHLCTLGGEVYHGLAIYDYLNSIKSKYNIKVNIFVQGYVCSAGTMCLMAGDQRYISQNSFLMLHELSTMFAGNYEQLKEQAILCEKLMNKVYLIYANNSKVTVQKLKEILKNNLWLTAQQAIDYGFVTKIG